MRWERKRIGDICKTGAGGTPLKSNPAFYEPSAVPWLLSGEIGHREIFETKNQISIEGLENSSAKIFPRNSVLIAMYGATAGEVGVLKCEASTNQAVCAIYPNPHLLHDFIYYFMVSFKRDLVAQAVGGAQPNISQAKIRAILMPVPPMEEQERIVEILDQAFEAIDKAKANIERNLANARELFQSRLNEIFSNPPSDWEVKPLGEVCDIQNGFAFKSKDYSEDGARIIRIGNVQKGTIRDKAPRFIPIERVREFLRFELNKGDLLISLTGDVGRVGKFPETLLPALLNQRVGRFQDIDENQIDYTFLFHALNSDWFENLVIDSSEGAAQKNTSTKKIKSIKIPVPNLSIQVRLAKELDLLFSKIHILSKKNRQQSENLEELRQSILEQAFEGKLTEPVTS